MKKKHIFEKVKNRKSPFFVRVILGAKIGKMAPQAKKNRVTLGASLANFFYGFTQFQSDYGHLRPSSRLAKAG